MGYENIKDNFTRRYIIAITLIALLAIGALYILNLALKTSDSTALIVNISGKQRMLSQRIASFSQQHYLYTFHISTSEDLLAVHTSLNAAIKEMRNANLALSTGRLNEKTVIELSPTITDIYFGELQLKERVENYLSLAESISHESNHDEALNKLHMLLSLSNTLLLDLHVAVQQYQKEGEDNLASIRHLESTAFFLTFIVLMLEVIFIFQPMANKIQNLFQKLIFNQENLELQIQMRTLSLEQANYKLLHLASHDPLTGLKNRLNLEKDLNELIIHHREHHAPFAVAMFDIDWFKKINDTYGHDVGDFVLCEIGKILIDNTRDKDSVYRSGGEEFVVLFNRITREEALIKANTIRLTIQEHLFAFKNREIRVSISGGIYHPDILEASSVQEILKYADVALYQAKQQGRNKVIEVQKN